MHQVDFGTTRLNTLNHNRNPISLGQEWVMCLAIAIRFSRLFQHPIQSSFLTLIINNPHHNWLSNISLRHLPHRNSLKQIQSRLRRSLDLNRPTLQFIVAYCLHQHRHQAKHSMVPDKLYIPNLLLHKIVTFRISKKFYEVKILALDI